MLYELKRIGVDNYAYYMNAKGVPVNIMISGLTCGQANIIKQEAIASGIDAAVSKGTSHCMLTETDVLILGSEHGLNKLIKRLDKQPCGLKEIADKIKNKIKSKRNKKLILRDRTLTLENPTFMYILNMSPDSFSGDGLSNDRMIIKDRLAISKEENIDIIDIGGESTRPGSRALDTEEELKRIMPALHMALEDGFIVSVDTYKSHVAEETLKSGAHLINDISGLRYDKKMAGVCSKYDAAVSIMHTNGTPDTMQVNPVYSSLIKDVKDYLSCSVDLALKEGIKSESIIIDPGFGFGKTLEHNYILLKYLNEFTIERYPLLVGLSRKSLIGNIIQKPENERLVGSIVLETIALLKGADIIRAHDINETREMLALTSFYNKVNIDAANN